MRRRKLIILLGGAAAARPFAARAQQGRSLRRVALLMGIADDPEGRSRTEVFRQALRARGWTEADNIEFNYRWHAANDDEARRLAEEILQWQPDVILSNSTFMTIAAGKATSTIPIVFTNVSDPTAAGVVGSLAIVELAEEQNSALLVINDVFTTSNRHSIIAVANERRLPTLYPYKFFARDGGLMSYGIEPTGVFRQAAVYVDRILKGEKPGELPVQAPNKFELVINLKTAAALGLTVPPNLLATADEVIE